MAISNVVSETISTDFEDADSRDVARANLAEQHCLYSQHVLEAMAQVKIVLNEAGLTLLSPGRNTWEPDSMAKNFAEMPEAFARLYLQMRVRNFLHETFGDPDIFAGSALTSSSEVAGSETSPLDLPNLMNDRIGGGLHVGLLEQVTLSNQGKGYFDPGWQVVREDSYGAIAVQKHGIVLYVESRHLSPEKQSERQAKKQTVQPGELLAIRLPGYRLEPDFYIAIGDQGPVYDMNEASEIYFAATDAAMPLIMKTLTTALNGEQGIPYTLLVPYAPEGYEGPEAIVLRIEKAAFDQVLPLLQQIWELCSQAVCSDPKSALLRAEFPVFAYPLWPGISMADVIESSATEWFGSSAELSRMHLVAEALTQVWYESLAEEPSTQVSPSQNLLAMQAQFSQAQLSWEQPFNRAWN